MVYSEKVALLSPPLTGVPGLQYTGSNTTKKELPTKFLKRALKLTENFKEVVPDGGSYKKICSFQTCVFLKLLR